MKQQLTRLSKINIDTEAMRRKEFWATIEDFLRDNGVTSFKFSKEPVNAGYEMRGYQVKIKYKKEEFLLEPTITGDTLHLYASKDGDKVLHLGSYQCLEWIVSNMDKWLNSWSRRLTPSRK